MKDPYGDKKELASKILSETIDRYLDVSARCITPEGDCVYGDGRGRACAVGHHLLPEVRDYIASVMVPRGDQETDASKSFRTAAADTLVGSWLKYGDKKIVDPKELDDLLVPEARGINVGFWLALQSLHDSFACWAGKQSYHYRIECITSNIFLAPLVSEKYPMTQGAPEGLA